MKLWYGYDGRYGKCVGIRERQGGWVFVMADGSEHFAGDCTWIARAAVALGFLVLLIVRRSF